MKDKNQIILEEQIRRYKEICMPLLTDCLPPSDQQVYLLIMLDLPPAKTRREAIDLISQQLNEDGNELQLG
jgi:hypothetical protein